MCTREEQPLEGTDNKLKNEQHDLVYRCHIVLRKPLLYSVQNWLLVFLWVECWVPMYCALVDKRPKRSRINLHGKQVTLSRSTTDSANINVGCGGRCQSTNLVCSLSSRVGRECQIAYESKRLHSNLIPYCSF